MSRRDLGTRMLYSSSVGRARRELYRGAHVQLKAALQAGFWIEAIALCESMLSDRLEARYSFIAGDTEEARRHKTIGTLLKQLRANDRKKDNERLHTLYAEIAEWSKQRNRAVHHAVKLSDGENFEPWSERYAGLQLAATEGAALVRRLKNELERLKRKGI